MKKTQAITNININIKLFVCCHSEPFYPRGNSLVFIPIQCGRATAKEKFSLMIGDDTGVEISSKNHLFCELTGLFWIWKNIEISDELIGIQHYRRFLNISPKEMMEYDVIIPEPDYCSSMISPQADRSMIFSEILTEWTLNSPIIQIILEHYPMMKSAVEQNIFSNRTYFKNILVSRKEVFLTYCEFLFNIIEIIEKKHILFPVEPRYIGFFSENLTSFFIHFLKMNQKLKIKEVPICNYDDYIWDKGWGVNLRHRILNFKKTY